LEPNNIAQQPAATADITSRTSEWAVGLRHLVRPFNAEEAMRWSHALLAPLWVAASCSLGWAVDYSKADRTIKAEPVYQSKSPRYALLVFGPQAKLRVWVATDGETIYVDRNSDGDLTEKGKRFPTVADCKNIELADPDGKTRYVITGISAFKEEASATTHLMVSVDIKGPISYRQYCDAAMADSPAKAPIAHFHGPLTMGPRTINWKLPPKLALVSGEKPADLPGTVGTMNAEYGCWVVVRSHNSKGGAFAKDVFPVVDVEFAPKTPGSAAVKKRYPLGEFC
jgi:hypothetical protein